MSVLCFLYLTTTPLKAECEDNQSIHIQAEEQTYYAKIQSTGVQFYSMPSESYALFEIPYSYFVQVEYVVDDFYKVTYKDLEGYVKKDEVTLMNGTPTTPYAEATFKLFVESPLYQSATNTSEIVRLDESVTITYYGTMTGQELRTGNTVWYYSSVVINNTTYYGYIYSAVTDLLTTISVNTETFDIVSEDVFSTTQTFTSLSTGTKILLIVAISVPSVLILYFLIKPSKIMQITKTKKNVKREKKKIHHGDYFEFDESEL